MSLSETSSIAPGLSLPQMDFQTAKGFLYSVLRFLDQKRFGKLEPERGNELLSSQLRNRACVEATYIADHAGALGHAVAQLFGVDPRQAMHEDLVQLKSLLEEGETSKEGTMVELR